MIAKANGETWADTPSVQAAVSRFNGRHVGFGDFAIVVDDEDIYLARADGTRDGDAIAEKYNFTGRPHHVAGDAQAIATMIEELE